MAQQYSSVFRAGGETQTPAQAGETPFQKFRREHPEYNLIPDLKLAGALRNKVPEYKAMPIEQFYTQIGLGKYVSPKSNPTDGMSGPQKFFSGVGKFATDQATGVRQLTGFASQQEVDDKKRIDAPLMETGAGKAGVITGGLASVVLPGYLGGRAVNAATAAGTRSRLGEMAVSATMPKTVLGAGGQGSALGFIQPVASDESRLMNTVLGGGLGMGGQIGGNTLAALLRASRGQAITQGGLNKRAADTLRENAIKGEAGLLSAAPSAVPGVARTLAEESLDDGIAGLQRTVLDPAYVTNQGRVNNAARVNYLREIAGDEDAMAAAVAAREANNADAFTRARGERFSSGVAVEPGVTVDRMIPLYRQLDEIRAGFAGGDSARVVDGYAKRIREANGNSVMLDNIRKDVALAMQQKPDGVNIRDLAQVYDALAGHLKNISPNYREAIDGWARDSIPIDRMRIGQELTGIRSGSAILDPVTGEQVLLPAQFSRAARDLDALSQRATGFNRASAEDYLSPDDIARIRAVQDDLERQSFAQTAGGRPGSPTFDRMEMAGKIANSAMPIPQIVKDGFAVLDNIGQQRLKSKLSEVLANPQQARELLKRYPASDARVIEGVLKRIGWTGGFAGNLAVQQ